MKIPAARRLPSTPLITLTVLALACSPDAPANGGAQSQDPPTVELAAPVEAAGLSIALPAAWTRRQPGSSMRLLEAGIPGSAGPGEISVYYFGPGGAGGPAANIDRWKSQVTSPPGKPEATTQTRENDGVRLTWVELEGLVRASTVGSFPAADMPDAALYGAIIEAPGGPWFVRAVGPGATMREQRQAFLDMLDSARPAG